MSSFAPNRRQITVSVRPRTEPSSSSVRKRSAELDMLAYIAANGSIPSQNFLRERWGLRAKSTVSEWLSEWEKKGLIVRHRDGRCKVTTSVLH